MTLQKYFIPLQLFFIQNLILECCDIHHPHQIDKEKSHTCDFTKIKKNEISIKLLEKNCTEVYKIVSVLVTNRVLEIRFLGSKSS